MKKAIRRTGTVLGGLVVVLALALAAVYGVSEARLRRKYDVRPAAVTIPVGAEAVRQGERLAAVRGCTDCHGPGLRGQMVIDEAPVARLAATNLTRGSGGVAAGYTDADWVRAIRHGVAPDGRALLLMPSHEFNPLGDGDLGALIAYIRSLPPTDNRLPAVSVGPVGRALFLAGQIPLVPAELIDHAAPRGTPPSPAATAEYGAYLATGCTGCHGPGFSGGKVPGGPPEWGPASNLTPDPATGLGRWTEQDFVRALREGKRPDGKAISTVMPWKSLARMTDDEVRALWLYLRTVPEKPFGGR
ncbi:MAG TPA: c-type cytochrome [Longimicrobiaceae bacterium]